MLSIMMKSNQQFNMQIVVLQAHLFSNALASSREIYIVNTSQTHTLGSRIMLSMRLNLHIKERVAFWVLFPRTNTYMYAYIDKADVTGGTMKAQCKRRGRPLTLTWNACKDF